MPEKQLKIYQGYKAGLISVCQTFCGWEIGKCPGDWRYDEYASRRKQIPPFQSLAQAFLHYHYLSAVVKEHFYSSVCYQRRA